VLDRERRSGGDGPAVKREDRTEARVEDGLVLEEPLHERVKAAIPALLASLGWPGGEVAVTSVPDLIFKMRDRGKVWEVTYNALTGSVSGRPAETTTTAEPLTVRRFLTRLHTTHGYPSEVGGRWAWAVIVDVMAFIMLFWAMSGLFMWWQLRAVRTLGILVVLLSFFAAAWMALSMYGFLASTGRGM